LTERENGGRKRRGGGGWSIGKWGRTGLKVSAFCLGTMMSDRQVDEPESLRIIGKALDSGVTFIDTADMYANG